MTTAAPVSISTAVAAVSSGGIVGVVLGTCLVMAALVLYRLLPKLDHTINRVFFKDGRTAGQRLRTVGGPLFLGILGTACSVAGLSNWSMATNGCLPAVGVDQGRGSRLPMRSFPQLPESVAWPSGNPTAVIGHGPGWCSRS
jgi:hypothetical protein